MTIRDRVGIDRHNVTKRRNGGAVYLGGPATNSLCTKGLNALPPSASAPRVGVASASSASQ